MAILLCVCGSLIGNGPHGLIYVNAIFVLPLLVNLFGKDGEAWHCWKRCVLGGGLRGCKIPHHSQLALPLCLYLWIRMQVHCFCYSTVPPHLPPCSPPWWACTPSGTASPQNLFKLPLLWSLFIATAEELRSSPFSPLLAIVSCSLLSLLQITGAILLAVGVWGKLTLGTYISLIAENSTNAPYVLIGTGTTIVVFGLFGCFATCRGSPWMLKLVSLSQRNVLSQLVL